MDFRVHEYQPKTLGKITDGVTIPLRLSSWTKVVNHMRDDQLDRGCREREDER